MITAIFFCQNREITGFRSEPRKYHLVRNFRSTSSKSGILHKKEGAPLLSGAAERREPRRRHGAWPRKAWELPAAVGLLPLPRACACGCDAMPRQIPARQRHAGLCGVRGGTPPPALAGRRCWADSRAVALEMVVAASLDHAVKAPLEVESLAVSGLAGRISISRKVASRGNPRSFG
jgi:hypothetical protein